MLQHDFIARNKIYYMPNIPILEFCFTLDRIEHVFENKEMHCFQREYLLTNILSIYMCDLHVSYNKH